MNTIPLMGRGGRPKKNQGFVLITSAIFLVVLTLLVIYAARSAIVSERGSSNMRNRSQAFQMAELAQRWAMNQLTEADDIATWNGSGYILKGTDPDFSSAGNSCAINANCNLAKGANSSQAFPLSNSDLKVEEMPSFVIKDLQQEANDCKYYEVTSRGVGMNSKSVVYIRTVAKACSA